MSVTAALVIRSLEEELHNFDQVTDTTAPLREEVVNIAMAQVRRIDPTTIDPTDKDAVAATTAVIKTALAAIDSKESSAVRKINTKIKQADQKRADATSDLVVDLYKKMATGVTATPNGPIDLSADLSSIDSAFTLEGGQISETELREDRDDLS